MMYPKVKSSVEAALKAIADNSSFDAVQFFDKFNEVFSSEKDFLSKVNLLDAVFDDHPQIDELREVFFDLLMINFFSEDVKKLEEDYLDSKEWADIEEKTIDRGTELLNVLLYLTECADEDIEPELEDFLKEFLLVDEDEFQDEYHIYEPIIANQILIESSLQEVHKVAVSLPENSELKELFYPVISFFKYVYSSKNEIDEVVQSAVNKQFDIAVYQILANFK